MSAQQIQKDHMYAYVIRQATLLREVGFLTPHDTDSLLESFADMYSQDTQRLQGEYIHALRTFGTHKCVHTYLESGVGLYQARDAILAHFKATTPNVTH